MVSSKTYPGLERKPGGPDNWVEKAGGLPKYIERIAKHLHYEEGMTISHAIATAVNTVKRWARKGGVVKYGDPNNKNVTTITAAQAAKAVAEWEAKKAGAKSRSGGRIGSKSINLVEGNVDLDLLVERANAIEDPASRGKARQAILDLAVIDLALTKDGRKSYKKQGKWKHGFIPVDEAAKTSKAKGSPVARKRMNRLYGSPGQRSQATKSATKRTLKLRAIGGGKNDKDGGSTETVSRLGALRNADIRDATQTQRATNKVGQAEVGKKGRFNATAMKAWSEIPDEAKITRNGKRYVIANQNGRKLLTEWVGSDGGREQTDYDKDTQYRSIESRLAKNKSTAELGRITKNMKQDKSVRSTARKVLDKKRKERKKG